MGQIDVTEGGPKLRILAHRLIIFTHLVTDTPFRADLVEINKNGVSTNTDEIKSK